MNISFLSGLLIVICVAIICAMIENIIKAICNTITETSRNKLAIKRYDDKFIDADYQ